jgi:hypothetical protein
MPGPGAAIPFALTPRAEMVLVDPESELEAEL